MKPHEANYPTHDLELGAVVFTLNIWRNYMYGVRRTIYMDHKSLRYLKNQPNLNIRQGRWLDVVKDYDSEILYHLGKTNVVANALSRRVVSTLIQNLCFRVTVVTPVLEMIRVAQSEAIKEENWKSEQAVCQLSAFDHDSRGLLMVHDRIWVPYSGRNLHILMDKAHKLRIFYSPRRDEDIS